MDNKVRPTIGFVMLSPEAGPYQQALLAGAHAAAQERDVNLLVFSESFLDAKRRHQAPQTPLDGLMLYTRNTIDIENFADWRSLPRVSLAEPLPGIPSIIVDNADGFTQLLEHLFADHQYRNPAFVSGPAVSRDAVERLAIFQKVTAAHGLSTPPERIHHGGFVFSDGIDAVNRFWGDGQPPPDVVVCANDNMAHGALHALLGRGLEVPRHVAVTGFDDLRFSYWCPSPLTTVHHPVSEAGHRALTFLLDQIQDPKRVSWDGEDIRLATSLVRRQSCGCLFEDREESASAHLREVLSFQHRIEDDRLLDNLFARYTQACQETGTLSGQAGLISQVLKLVGLPWWALNHADPRAAEGGGASSRHLVWASGDFTDRPTASFPDGLGLGDRWTVLQFDLGEAAVWFGTLVLEYREGVRERYQGIQSRMDEAIGSLRNTLRLKSLNQSLVEASRRLESLSLQDDLTGAHNRRGFLTLGDRQLASSRRQSQSSWLFFVDLDGLKAINDQWGHEAGDLAIQTFCRILSRSIRSTDLMARLGGDEFTILASNADAATENRLRSRIDLLLTEYNLKPKGSWTLAYSLGGVFAPPVETATLLELMNQADAKLYSEKQAKRAAKRTTVSS